VCRCVSYRAVFVHDVYKYFPFLKKGLSLNEIFFKFAPLKYVITLEGFRQNSNSKTQTFKRSKAGDYVNVTRKYCRNTEETSFDPDTTLSPQRMPQRKLSCHKLVLITNLMHNSFIL
jgi:hypothetical protein